MAAPQKNPTTADEIEARTPGGDAFVLPDLPDVMTRWVSLTSSNMQAWQTEMTNFVARRFEHDRVTMQRFASCRDLMQAARVQQDWFADAFAAYLEESRRLAAIAIEPATVAATTVRRGRPSQTA
jgi:Phasin protein